MTAGREGLLALPPFASVSRPAARAAIVAMARSQPLAPGAVAVREGEPVTAVAMVASGALRVGFGGGAVESLELGPGDLFGELEFFRPLPATATVAARVATHLWTLDHAPLRQLLAADPTSASELYHGFLGALIAKHCAVSESLVAWKLDLVARQAAHDLRAPLAALKVLAGRGARACGDEAALFCAAVGRIDRIAASLLPPQPRVPGLSAAGLATALRALLAEKRAQHLDRLDPAAWQGHGLGRPRGDRRQVACDRNALIRAASNLLDNAAQAGARHICLRLAVGPREAHLAVDDDGGGVASGGGCGHGLGLGQARRAAAACGGELTLRSRPGGGTRACLRLARAPSARRDAVAVARGGGLGL